MRGPVRGPGRCPWRAGRWVPTSCRGLYRYCCSVWCVTMSSVSRMLRLLCSRDCMSRHTALTFSLLHGMAGCPSAPPRLAHRPPPWGSCLRPSVQPH